MGFKENLKSELAYSGMLVKELAAKSGVNKYSIDHYLSKRGQMPTIQAAVKIAQALDVSVEYLVTGKEGKKRKEPRLSNEALTVGHLVDQLDVRDRKFIIDFIKLVKARQ
jgi:transcriptional regulator with XRE-family HTH domain